MKNKLILSTDKLKREKKTKRVIKIVLLIILLILLLLYFAFRIIYNSGNFSVTLDDNLYFKRGLIIYDDPLYKVYRTELLAKAPETFDNISYKWLPEDLDKYEGSHNGDNYLVYSFYIENMGDDITDYWGEIIIDDVIKNVDEAVRIRVYKNGEYLTYAKLGKRGEVEKETVPFLNNQTIARYHGENFNPGDIDKFTIVFWLEGTDLECTDNILGGEFKFHMEFNSEIMEK